VLPVQIHVPFELLLQPPWPGQQLTVFLADSIAYEVPILSCRVVASLVRDSYHKQVISVTEELVHLVSQSSKESDDVDAGECSPEHDVVRCPQPELLDVSSPTQSGTRSRSTMDACHSILCCADSRDAPHPQSCSSGDDAASESYAPELAPIALNHAQQRLTFRLKQCCCSLMTRLACSCPSRDQGVDANCRIEFEKTASVATGVGLVICNELIVDDAMPDVRTQVADQTFLLRDP
jgi:hypothetical protein